MGKVKTVLIMLFFLSPVIHAFPDYGISPNGGPDFVDDNQLFTFIAKQEGLSTDPNTIHNLTQDSMQITVQHPLGRFTVIKAECMGEEFSRIRSFHGNGSYYVVLKDKKKVQLVGFTVGNHCRWDVAENNIRLIVNYHVSVEPSETVYQWNGTIFQSI